MAINLLVGRGVGAGKSYFAVTLVIKHVKAGGTVYLSDAMDLFPERIAALILRRYGLELPRVEGPKPPDIFDMKAYEAHNMAVREENARREIALTERHPGAIKTFLNYVEPMRDDRYPQFRFLPHENIVRVHELTAGGTDDCPVLIVLDEAQDKLNAKDWADKEKRGLFNWACQSRHDNNDILFITQAEGNIDKQVRSLSTFIYRVRNMCNFRILGLGRWPLKQFVVSQMDGDGRTRLERLWIWQDQEIFDCYRSKSMAGKHKRLHDPIPRVMLKRRKDKHPMIKWAFLGIVVLSVYFGFRAYQAGRRWLEPVAATSPTPAANAKKPEPKKEVETQPQKVAVTATPKPAYEIISEGFRGSYGNQILTTDRGVYEVGKMSRYGYVLAKDANVVRISKPDGGVCFVVATSVVEVRQKPEAPAPQSSATPIIAQWKPETPGPAAREAENQMREHLEQRVIGGRVVR